MVVAFAFHVLARHDADYERIVIGEHEVRVEARDAVHVEPQLRGARGAGGEIAVG